MKIKILLFSILAIFTSSCGTSAAETPIGSAPIQPAILTDAPLPTVTPVCVSSEPAQADIDRALKYTGDTLSGGEWERTSFTAEDRVTVTWQNVPEVAVVYLEALIFPCGHEEPDLDNYFNDENLKLIFQNYESFTLNGECRTDDGLRLYEFEAYSEAINYEIKFCVDSDTDTRVISTMITFPFGSESHLDAYASLLFPLLPNCS